MDSLYALGLDLTMLQREIMNLPFAARVCRKLRPNGPLTPAKSHTDWSIGVMSYLFLTCFSLGGFHGIFMLVKLL